MEPSLIPVVIGAVLCFVGAGALLADSRGLLAIRLIMFGGALCIVGVLWKITVEEGWVIWLALMGAAGLVVIGALIARRGRRI